MLSLTDTQLLCKSELTFPNLLKVAENTLKLNAKIVTHVCIKNDYVYLCLEW